MPMRGGPVLAGRAAAAPAQPTLDLSVVAGGVVLRGGTDVHVLDALSGRHLWSKPSAMPLASEGQVLAVLGPGGVAVHDVATGRELYSVEVPLGTLGVHAHEDRRRLPRAEPTWRRAIASGGDASSEVGGAVFAERRLALWRHRPRDLNDRVRATACGPLLYLSSLFAPLEARDLANGAVRWSVPQTRRSAPLADRHGVIAGRGRSLCVAYDLDGRVRWQRNGTAWGIVEDTVVVAVEPELDDDDGVRDEDRFGLAVECVDRRTGRARAVVGAHGDERGAAFAIADGVVYHLDEGYPDRDIFPSLTAVRPDGQVLWRLDEEALSELTGVDARETPFLRVAAAGGRLYLLAEDGTAACLRSA
jgi:hypothetical protein